MLNKVIIGVLLVFILNHAKAQEAEKNYVLKDYVELSKNLTYLGNDLAVQNNSSLKGFHDAKLIKDYITLEENEFVEDVHLSKYIIGIDSTGNKVNKGIWAVYIFNEGPDSSKIEMYLERLYDAEGKELDTNYYRSTGLLESEVMTFLWDDELVSFDSQDVFNIKEAQADSAKVRSGEGNDSVEAIKNHPIDLLLNEDGIIPFEMPMEELIQKIGFGPSEVYCDECIDNTIQEWVFEPNTFFRVVHLKDGNVLYYVYNFNDVIIKDLFFGFSLGETSKKQILERFKDYQVDVHERKVDGESGSLKNEIIDVEHDDFFAQFSFENGRLFSIMIAKQKL